METQLRPVLVKRNSTKASSVLKTMWIMVATGLLLADSFELVNHA